MIVYLDENMPIHRRKHELELYRRKNIGMFFLKGASKKQGLSVWQMVEALADLRDWQENRIYLGGIDLFNHGYYWEAHEMWEALWHRTGGDAVTAMFLKGLIKLTAAGVKIREGNPRGTASLNTGFRQEF